MITPAELYWDAFFSEVADVDRADAIAAVHANGTKLKFFDAGGSLIRTITAAAFQRLARQGSFYPIVPGAFTDPGTGTGTPASVVFTTSGDAEIIRMSAGVLSGDFQVPEAFSEGKALLPGAFALWFPTTDTGVSPGSKDWYPGHYALVTDDQTRLGMTEYRRNLIKNEEYFAGYYGYYWWNRLESTQGNYDASIILDDLDKAQADGKKMWVKFMNRSFHGMSRGAFCPSYIVSGGGTYTYTQGGQNFAGPKLWDPAVGEPFLDMMVAIIEATREHPALQGYATEESAMSGAHAQSGFSASAMEQFLREQSRLGALNCGSKLFHNNMGWSNRNPNDSDELAILQALTDDMVRVHGAGLCPQDLLMSLDSGTGAYPPTQTHFGRYLFDRYGGPAAKETFHFGFMDWGAYARPEQPAQLIHHNVDVLGVQFIGWFPRESGGTFNITHVKAAVAALQGKINTLRPVSAPE